MAKLSVRDLDTQGKRVLMRVDYNVPMEEKSGVMVINDTTRIKETLPTLQLLISKGARIVLAAHLGRPDGKREASMSLKPVAEKLAEMLGRPVQFVDETVGEKAEAAVAALKDGEILVLENVRFAAEEEENDPVFAARLARLADIYVNDAFGAAHRAHASTSGAARILKAWGKPCAAGLLMERELKFLGDELDHPVRPFVVILGGAKVSDKIKVIDSLLEKADTILIGGAMAYTFKLAHGGKTGKSLIEKDHTGTALAAEAKAKAKNVAFHLPSDTVVATPVATGKLNKKGKPVFEFVEPRVVEGDIPDDAEGFDIGPKTAAAYAEIVAGAKTILWNGPMGMFEDERFATGTVAVAKALAAVTEKGAKTIIGGGDSVKAINKAKLGDKVTFMSTGGGASLEFLEGISLPGVTALDDK
ncbi:MAG TPA: phosphoglycerate kinase [Candidatus Limnocylindria bacterium]|jgi:phosphoglycerate kinase|nr:phosphoglycerate kinase [Candidatus Limnocylindria bacterium]